MGCHPNISATRFPRQGSYQGLRTEVCFNYDTSVLFPGTIVRDDHEEPYLTLIQLDNGPIVTTTECQYSPKDGTVDPLVLARGSHMPAFSKPPESQVKTEPVLIAVVSSLGDMVLNQ